MNQWTVNTIQCCLLNGKQLLPLHRAIFDGYCSVSVHNGIYLMARLLQFATVFQIWKIGNGKVKNHRHGASPAGNWTPQKLCELFSPGTRITCEIAQAPKCTLTFYSAAAVFPSIDWLEQTECQNRGKFSLFISVSIQQPF